MAKTHLFDRNIYLSSIFDGDTIYYETALPLEGEDIALLFPIEEVLSVKDYGLNIDYKEGIDYKVKDGKLVILPSGHIKITKFDEYYCKKPASVEVAVDNKHCQYHFNEQRYMMFGESNYMTDKQIAITYKHKGSWDLFRQKNQNEKLQRFLKKIKNKEEATIVFYGDSITVGCNSSGTPYGGNVSPYAEPWPIMVTEYLKTKYQTNINYINTAVGGMTTEWGVNNYQERVNKYHPDLMVLAFGMNDGSLPKEEHIKEIMSIVDGVKKENPQCDIILIATTVPNIESTLFQAQSTYIEEYKKINQDDVAIVDMTHMHMDLLKKKRFKDMTGNNVNHPNDFLARIYAQSILEVMGELKE